LGFHQRRLKNLLWREQPQKFLSIQNDDIHAHESSDAMMSNEIQECTIMNYIACIVVSGKDNREHRVVGQGMSQEEAEQNCLQRLREELEVLVKLAEGIAIPLGYASKVPKELPVGYQLVVFERSSHCSGDSYDWRFFAVKPGSYRLGENRGETQVGSAPVIIHTMDSNSDVEYPLPHGSMEYVGGQWLPSKGVAYNY
jgi:hypothetical protein